MFTGDKAEVINPNRVHEGPNKRAFVCLSVCDRETVPNVFTLPKHTKKGRFTLKLPV